ncbi:peptidoglycan DD-metalloendopeptidase family protein [Paraflavisolibacter sp. H34]|uniref:peptidoglycan DD-metalloendopeptidase family protein n=1 Tax=Huijunlia imazamoxiresistens TaxID=3127457 RepID=UPI0030159F02
MAENSSLETLLQQHQPYHPVVPFDAATDKLQRFDFSQSNTELSEDIFNDTQRFSHYIQTKLQASGARYGIGGYGEHRTIYQRSALFSEAAPAGGEAGEPRRFHLGIDIWGKPLTPVRAPLFGVVHSFAFNHAYGDYGGTIILSHRLEDHSFFTLYGHLSLNSLRDLREGQQMERGDVFAEFGIPQENGNWPPHLHFQIIKNLQGRSGDYPGVCAFSERAAWLANCPDPDLILQLMPFARE